MKMFLSLLRIVIGLLSALQRRRFWFLFSLTVHVVPDLFFATRQRHVSDNFNNVENDCDEENDSPRSDGWLRLIIIEIFELIVTL